MLDNTESRCFKKFEAETFHLQIIGTRFCDLIMQEARSQSPFTLKTLLYVVLGIGSILYYTQVGGNMISQYYFGREASVYFHLAVLGFLSILSITAVGCSIHLRNIGGFERGELLREFSNSLEALKNTRMKGLNAIADVESRLPKHAPGLSTRAIEAMRILRQIIHSIDLRVERVESLARLNRMPELCQAVDLLRMKLRSCESASQNLIDIDPFPAIPAAQVSSVVDDLVSRIREGLRLAA